MENRLLMIMIERHQAKNDYFCRAVPAALREYADALDIDNTRGQITGEPFKVDDDCVKFEASNGCIIKAIAGAFD